MRRSNRSWWCATALVLFAASANAAPREWNQERVAGLARDLIAPIEALRKDLRERPPVPGKEQARASVVDDVERLYSDASELAQRLEEGAGRAETAPLFRRIESVESQAKTHTRDYSAPFDMHVYIDRIQSITTQLAPYYEETAASGR